MSSFFNDYKDELRNAINIPDIKYIAELDEFYLQKAKDKFEELEKMDTSGIDFSSLSEITKQKSFDFKNFLNSYSTGSNEYKLLLLIGQVISYFDSNAAMKNELNEYEDKRTIGKSGARQDHWVKSLLKYKSDDNHIDSLSRSMLNAILFIKNPKFSLSILSDKLKKQINDSLFNGNDETLFIEITKLGIAAKNPMNNGILYSKILWSKPIKKLWDKPAKQNTNNEKETKQLVYHDGRYSVDIDISVDEWKAMLSDKKIFDDVSVDMIRKWYFQAEHQATNKEILKIYENEYAHLKATPFNGIVKGLSLRILRYIDRFNVLGTKGEDSYWCIPFEGWHKNYNKYDDFIWKIRKELVLAIEELNLFECRKPYYSKNDFLSEVYFDSEKYDDIAALLERKKNIILQGAPGVGKSYMAKRLAYSIIGAKDDSKIKMIQFHQNYSYEDFIEGFRPHKDGKFELTKGIFYNFCDKAKKDISNDYFFIIDEINRGNLSKVMGELMLLLENDKRGKEFEIPLTYSGEPFYVPENVYVIGMMNTADRSLAMIDYALRRRFCFIPIEPVFNNSSFIAAFKNNYPDAEKIIGKIKNLNKFISDNLDSGHQIGHSYFCSEKPLTQKDIDGIIKYEIEELLNEYFFDDEKALKDAKSILS